MTGTTFIYVLKEPDTGEIRYVGKSNNPKHRLRHHLRDNKHNRRTAWIEHLRGKGELPVLEIIDEVPIEHWQQWEVAWIEYFKEQGCDLVNGTLGGDGLIPTPEVLKKLSRSHLGKTISYETRAKMSASHSGEKSYWFGKRGSEHNCFGRCQSEEAKRKFSAAVSGAKHWLFGKTHSLETRKKMSESRKGKTLSPEQCRAISERMLGTKLSAESIQKRTETRRANARLQGRKY